MPDEDEEQDNEDLPRLPASQVVILNEAPIPTNRGTLRGGDERVEEKDQHKKLQALELRKAGATYDQIARQLNYATRAGAAWAVKAALREITLDVAEEVRDMELARLDTVLLGIWQEVRKGSLPHIDRFLRIANQRALYLGLYSATKIQSVNLNINAEFAGKTDSELVNEFSGLIESIRTRKDPTTYDGA